MDIEKTRELLPLFITGNLSTEDVLSVSRLLAQSPSLVGELRLTLALHDGLMRDAPLPPFPAGSIQRISRQRAGSRRSCGQLEEIAASRRDHPQRSQNGT